MRSLEKGQVMLLLQGEPTNTYASQLHMIFMTRGSGRCKMKVVGNSRGSEGLRRSAFLMEKPVTILKISVHAFLGAQSESKILVKKIIEVKTTRG